MIKSKFTKWIIGYFTYKVTYNLFVFNRKCINITTST